MHNWTTTVVILVYIGIFKMAEGDNIIRDRNDPFFQKGHLRYLPVKFYCRKWRPAKTYQNSHVNRHLEQSDNRHIYQKLKI
jgi:hypothetical protein